MSREQRIILLAGPTGVGKTAASLSLAERLRTEVVNADSMQIYRYLDIGTAKPTWEERERVRHHLLDIVDPDETFDAARYLEVAAAAIDAIHQHGKVPLVVGGTGLYMKVLTRGICEAAPADANLRRQLLQELEARGLPRLHQELIEVDPELAAKIHPNDRQRIIRALEVYRLTQTPLSRWQSQHRFQAARYRSIKVFLFRDRHEMVERIDRRVHWMMEQGFLHEVEQLLAMGYSPTLKPLQALGYKQLIQHLSGQCSVDEAIQQIKRATRHYAKRQLTWFRGDPEFFWLHAEDDRELEDFVQRALEKPAPTFSRIPNYS